MTSPLPPRRRDTTDRDSLLRHQRQNLRQLDPGLAGGRFPLAKPLRPTSADLDDDDDVDVEIGFWNTDTGIATGPGQMTLRLTHTPIDGSLHVRWNGLDQPPTEWSLVDDVLIVPDPDSMIHAGDVISTAYAYEMDDEPDTPNPIFVGATVVGDTSSSIALPEGTREGDLMVFAACGIGPVSTSDSRLTETIDTFYADGIKVYWGFATGSDAPVPVSLNGLGAHWAVAALAVYRGVRVIESDSSTVAGTSATLPELNSAVAALGIILVRNGITAAQPSADVLDRWTQNTWVSATKVHIEVFSWVDDSVAQPTPPGRFTIASAQSTWFGITLKLAKAVS